MFPDLAGVDAGMAASGFAEQLAELSSRCGLQQRLREVGILADALPMLAKDAMNQTRLLVNNPRVVTEQDALEIYQAAW